MNLINLKRMYNHILENVPHEKIKMRYFRDGNKFSHECGSTGCVIGHCTILDDFQNIPFNDIGEIDFEKWSENFTGLKPFYKVWNWCFSPRWPNIKEQILLRIKYLIDNQTIPKDFNDYDYILPIQKLELYELN